MNKIEEMLKAKDHNLAALLTDQQITAPKITGSNLLITSYQTLTQFIASNFSCNYCLENNTIELQDSDVGRGTTKLTYICTHCENTFNFSSDPTLMKSTSSRIGKSWIPNLVILSYMATGQYYKDYNHTMQTLGLPTITERQWINTIQKLSKVMSTLADWSCGEVRKQIEARGDQKKVESMYDGFWLTKGYHSNNASATLHDQKSKKIMAYSHRTKRGPSANW